MNTARTKDGPTRLSSSTENWQVELTRRHKAAATTVAGLIVGTVLLSVVAYLGRDYFRQQPNPSLDIASRITILILGLGSIAWRRTKFTTLRLQDIGALQGAPGLIRTIEKTTLQLALIAAAIVVIGFITTLLTGNEYYTYTGGAVGLVVLLYCYPTKRSWLKAVQRFADNQGPPPPPSDLGPPPPPSDLGNPPTPSDPGKLAQ
ncbi:MAG TPA: hypothetical protein VLA93_08650 [Pyrinomonadaceae bacterium]|nr:hypothetical protein [Pyrinomonadaceae bacterium]